jgi:hypothetical protein
VKYYANNPEREHRRRKRSQMREHLWKYNPRKRTQKVKPMLEEATVEEEPQAIQELQAMQEVPVCERSIIV